jgi:hypothetical protein
MTRPRRSEPRASDAVISEFTLATERVARSLLAHPSELRQTAFAQMTSVVLERWMAEEEDLEMTAGSVGTNLLVVYEPEPNHLVAHTPDCPGWTAVSSIS